MNANKTLKKHEDKNEFHFYHVDREWIIEAMEDYAKQKAYQVLRTYVIKLHKITPIFKAEY